MDIQAKRRGKNAFVFVTQVPIGSNLKDYNVLEKVFPAICHWMMSENPQDPSIPESKIR